MPICIQVCGSLCLLWGASALVNGAVKGERDEEVGFGTFPYNSRTVYVCAAQLSAMKFIQGMHCTSIPNRQYEADFCTAALDCLWLTNRTPLL